MTVKEASKQCDDRKFDRDRQVEMPASGSVQRWRIGWITVLRKLDSIFEQHVIVLPTRLSAIFH